MKPLTPREYCIDQCVSSDFFLFLLMIIIEQAKEYDQADGISLDTFTKNEKWDLETLREEYNIATDHLHEVNDLILWITKDVYDKKLQEIEDAIQLRSTELDEHYRADTDYKTTIGLVFSVAQRAEQIFLSSEPDEKRQFLNFLLQNPVVNRKNLYYTMKSPFNLLLNLPTHSNWGATIEAVRTIFETQNDTTIYIPDYSECEEIELV